MNFFEFRNIFNDYLFKEGIELSKMQLKNLFFISAGGILGLGILGYILIKTLAPKGTVITSWWRNYKNNLKITGKDFSWHMWGLVYDITGPNNTVSKELFEWAKSIFPVVIVERGTQITSLSEADHLHVGWINKRMGVQSL